MNALHLRQESRVQLSALVTLLRHFKAVYVVLVRLWITWGA